MTESLLRRDSAYHKTLLAIKMKIKYHIVIIILTYSKLGLAQQDYFKYHQQINLAEELFVDEKFEESVTKYDSIISKYDYVFLKDLLVAAQIAVLSNNLDKSDEWLEKAIRNGYDCKCIEKIKVFENYTKTDYWKGIVMKSEIYIAEYRNNINLDLHYEFHHRFKQEQESKRQREKYVKIVYDNYFRIKSLMDSLPFLSERIIGIDDESIFPTSSGGKLRSCEASNSKVIPTLLHYDNPITDIGWSKFIAAIKSGHLHPRQFADIYSFETNYVSRLNKNRNQNPSRLPKYWFNFAFGKKTNDIEQVNLDREKFGICSLELDVAKKTIAEKFGLKLDFGYK